MRQFFLRNLRLALDETLLLPVLPSEFHSCFEKHNGKVKLPWRISVPCKWNLCSHQVTYSLFPGSHNFISPVEISSGNEIVSVLKHETRRRDVYLSFSTISDGSGLWDSVIHDSLRGLKWRYHRRITELEIGSNREFCSVSSSFGLLK